MTDTVFPSLEDKVWTTFPILENHSIPTSNRLIYRILDKSDLEAYHSIRQDSEAMFAFSQSKASPDLETSRKEFEHTQFNLRTVRFGIFLKKLDGSEGELIGEGGVQIFESSWPSIYYVFKKKYWGKGYATEFVKAFLDFWWHLPRENVRREMRNLFVDDGTQKTRELLCASTKDNEGSDKVLQKTGFKLLRTKDETPTGYTIWQYPFPMVQATTVSLE